MIATHFDRSYLMWVACAFLVAYILVLMWFSLSSIVSYSPSRALTEKDLNLTGTACGIPLHFDA